MVAIIGSNGQLGNELVRRCRETGQAYVGLTHDDLDVTWDDDVYKVLFKMSPRPTVVINTAAYHNIEDCENNPVEAHDVNAVGSANIALWCRANNAKYVYISTEFCHGTPAQSGLPLSVYAKTKLAGELAALSICPDALVVRVAGLYGQWGCRAKGGSNFINAVLNKIRSGQNFTLPNDTQVYFTNARDAAIRIIVNLSKQGVWYATDGVLRSHYAIGGALCQLTGLPNRILGVASDPNDVLRPRLSKAGRHLHSASTSEDPLRSYLVEIGELVE